MIADGKKIVEKNLSGTPECYEDALMYLYAYQNGTDKRPPHNFDFTDGLAAIFEDALKAQIHEDKMVEAMSDISAIDDPLEPMKVFFALRSELMKYDLRKQKDPESISPLDITIIKVLADWLELHGYGVKEER